MTRHNFAKNIRIQKLQNKHHMVGQAFSTLNDDERRRNPRYGAWQFDPNNQEELKETVRNYHAETERLLKVNPNLKLVD